MTDRLLTFADLRHTTDLDFVDVSSELSRAYPGGTVVYRPVALAVTTSGSHRVLDALGVSRRIDPATGACISWMVASDAPHFVK